MSLVDETLVPVTRRIPFEFPDDLDPVWNTEQHEWSHMINGASVTMPYLEPFLIATLREAADHIDDPDLRILECTVMLKPGPGGFVAESMVDTWASMSG